MFFETLLFNHLLTSYFQFFSDFGVLLHTCVVFRTPNKNTFSSDTDTNAVQELFQALRQIDVLEKDLAAAEDQVVATTPRENS